MATTNITKRESDQTPVDRAQTRPVFQPRVDVLENKDEFVVVADLPGVAKDKLSIHVEREKMVLSGEVADAQPTWTPTYVEGHRGDWHREFRLPQGLDTEKVSADYKNGVLWVHLPKAAAVKPRSIQIKTE